MVVRWRALGARHFFERPGSKICERRHTILLCEAGRRAGSRQRPVLARRCMHNTANGATIGVDARTAQTGRRFRSALSEAQSKQYSMESRSEVRGELLREHLAIEETITDFPLVVGNRAMLLEYGPAAYEAMYVATRVARYHINLETYITGGR
jgi:hypothetical protein